MNEETINNRLEDLYNVLMYCSDRQRSHFFPVFKLVERIMINQERGALFSQLNKENPSDKIRFYECPPELEIKIRFSLQKIKDTNWGSFNQSRFLNN